MGDFQVIIGTAINKRQVFIAGNDDKGRLAVLCLYDLIAMPMYSQLCPMGAYLMEFPAISKAIIE